MPGVVCPNPIGAFCTFAQFPVDDTDRFCQWLLEEFDMMVKPLKMAPGLFLLYKRLRY